MGRLRTIRARKEAGVATAEYAITTVAACGLASGLLALLDSPTVRGILFDAVKSAFRFIAG